MYIFIIRLRLLRIHLYIYIRIGRWTLPLGAMWFLSRICMWGVSTGVFSKRGTHTLTLRSLAHTWMRIVTNENTEHWVRPTALHAWYVYMLCSKSKYTNAIYVFKCVNIIDIQIEWINITEESYSLAPKWFLSNFEIIIAYCFGFSCVYNTHTHSTTYRGNIVKLNVFHVFVFCLWIIYLHLQMYKSDSGSYRDCIIKLQVLS